MLMHYSIYLYGEFPMEHNHTFFKAFETSAGHCH